MISEDKLIAWLVFLNNQWNEDEVACAPVDVMSELRKRGWVESDDPDWQGRKPSCLSPAGQAIYDLNAPDYGIETLEESEA